MRKVLNVGGNNKSIALPEPFAEFEHVLLDIDPTGNPDIVCDARELKKLPPAKFDAVYCSHNLEHYYKHDVKKVLAGFFYVLKRDGFVNIRVPDMAAVMRAFVERNLDIEDPLYVSASGPITVLDVMYGYGVEIEQSGKDFYAHKTGFTQKSLMAALQSAGFRQIYIMVGDLEINAIAFKTEPNKHAKKIFKMQ